jgi:hypothetical protein
VLDHLDFGKAPRLYWPKDHTLEGKWTAPTLKQVR